MEALFYGLDDWDGPAEVAMVGMIWLVVFLFVCWLVKLLWNATLPELFGFKRLSYWMAIKITLLAGLLFGGLPTLSYSMG